jgi:HD-GYP domain-containing protein (c-di-GMP phosphodiesterase class II)
MRLAEVLGCLSLATDIVDGFRMEKAMRTAVLATAIADRARVAAPSRAASYWGGLVRFLGCTGFAPEESRHYSGGDDILLRSTLARVDFGSIADFAKRALPNIGKDVPILRRVTALAKLLGNPDAPKWHAEAQCEVGARLAEMLGLGEEVTRTLDLRDERFDGRGPRGRAKGEELPIAARIVDVADVAELFYGEGGTAAAIAAVRARSGGQLDPAYVDVFCQSATELLERIDAPSIGDTFLAAEPGDPRSVDASGLRRVATAFAHVIDLRSYFTGGHSIGTAALVERACAIANVDEAQRETAVVGALLHDIGNLAVPGGILDKPGPLTAWERERVKGHAQHTSLVLRAMPCLTRVADIACSAHEYGGSHGYPRATGPAALSLGARILMAADVHHALREPRAHRPAHDARQASTIVKELADAGRLCPLASRHVLEAAGHQLPRRALPRALSEREVEVLRLVAIGKTNRDIGELLAISPRTAQKHVMNVYDKIGVSSRAGAALFAAEHGLLEPEGH